MAQPSSKKSVGVTQVRRDAATLRRVFTSPDGRDALQILIRQFGGSCYAKGDPHHTAYLEGARDVLIYINSTINEKEYIDG